MKGKQNYRLSVEGFSSKTESSLTMDVMRELVRFGFCDDQTIIAASVVQRLLFQSRSRPKDYLADRDFEQLLLRRREVLVQRWNHDQEAKKLDSQLAQHVRKAREVQA
jgi:hypothetical protein